MKYYFVDLRALPISERIAACKKMEQYAWEVLNLNSKSGYPSWSDKNKSGLVYTNPDLFLSAKKGYARNTFPPM